MVRLVVTGGSLTRRPKRSLRCLMVEVPRQINEYLNLMVLSTKMKVLFTVFKTDSFLWSQIRLAKLKLFYHHAPVVSFSLFSRTSSSLWVRAVVAAA